MHEKDLTILHKPLLKRESLSASPSPPRSMQPRLAELLEDSALASKGQKERLDRRFSTGTGNLPVPSPVL